jgi:hypothetical protein
MGSGRLSSSVKSRGLEGFHGPFLFEFRWFLSGVFHCRGGLFRGAAVQQRVG